MICLDCDAARAIAPEANETSYWLLRHNNEVLVIAGEESEEIFPLGTPALLDHPKNTLLIGNWRGIPCHAADIDYRPKNIACELMPVRGLFGLGGAEAFALAGRATQLLDWQKNHRYCGRCGTPTNRLPTEYAMACTSCGLLVYPRISPAVMVLIERDDEILLARGPNSRAGVFSALAGFVEAGETLEQCAHREVREEVGLEIANLHYFHSQPWPFPDSLMIAFFADYVSGEITPDPSEIEAAAWFPRNVLPPLPDPMSIARQLIDAACLRV